MEQDATDGKPEVMTLTPDMIKRRLLWDISPHPLVEDISKRLELPEVSPEVFETEHQEAHYRMIPIQPMWQSLSVLGIYSTEILRAAMVELALAQGEEVDESRIVEVEQLAPFVIQATASILAELIDVGAIHLPHYGIMGTVEMTTGEDPTRE